MKVIFHLDLDSYFVSAQRTVDPRLNGKPVAISAGGRRSIISAASYEAKKMGVYVPMPLYRAKEACPDLVVVHPDFALYTVLSTKLFELISSKYTKNIEVASIDECYIDVTDIWPKYGSPYALAKDMQETVMKELKLPSSYGVGTNKFVAKMSTDINKPYGITVVKPEDFAKTFWDWPIIKFFGIGWRTFKKYEAIGIKTIGDLAKAKPEDIRDLAGISAEDYIARANGIGSDVIDSSHNELKSIGNEVTFQDYDRSERKDILEVFAYLVSMIVTRAKNRNIVGSVIHIHIAEKGGKEVKRHGKQRSLTIPTNDYQVILDTVISLFDEIWGGEILKHVGVQLGRLSNVFETTFQTSIFDQPQEKTKVQNIIDDINRQFKNKVVVTGKEGSMNLTKEQNQSRYIESDRIIKHYNKK